MEAEAVFFVGCTSASSRKQPFPQSASLVKIKFLLGAAKLFQGVDNWQI